MADDTSGIMALAKKFIKVLGPSEAEARVRTESPKIQAAMDKASDIHRAVLRAAQTIDPEVLVKGGSKPAERGAYGMYSRDKERDKDEIELDAALERIYTAQTQKTLSHELLHFLIQHDAIKQEQLVPHQTRQHRWIDAILGPGHPAEGDPQGPAPDKALMEAMDAEDRDWFSGFMERHLPEHAPRYPDSTPTTPIELTPTTEAPSVNNIPAILGERPSGANLFGVRSLFK